MTWQKKMIMGYDQTMANDNYKHDSTWGKKNDWNIHVFRSAIGTL